MKRNPIIRLFFMVVLCLFGVFYLILFAGSIYRWRVYPQTPQKVTLAQAVELDLHNQPEFLFFERPLYLSITNAVWECASLKHTGYRTNFSDKRRTDAVLTDANQTAVVFVYLDGYHSCQALQENEIAGELQDLETRPIEYQSDTTGKTIITTGSGILTFGLCAHCTPADAVSAPIGLALLPFVLWRLVEYWKRL